MSGNGRASWTTCKNGHPLSGDNLVLLRNGKRRCAQCLAKYTREWKRKKRRTLGIFELGKNPNTQRAALKAKRAARGYVWGEKPVCKNGHPRDARRSARYDCAVCHREQAVERDRKRGVKPAIRLTEEQRRHKKVEVETRRRARKRLAGKIATIDRIHVFNRDHGVCGICQTPVEFRCFEVDHVIPLARGGTHEYSNVQVAHPSCNRKKWALAP
jgi:5-methylcytosine-specific restriction endonuclease McrA